MIRILALNGEPVLQYNNLMSRKLWTAAVCCLVLFGCAPKETADRKAFETVTATVLNTDQFGDVLFDLESINLEYGDSVDVSFSGGYHIEDIPFYPDFYGKRGDTILCDFFETVCIAGIHHGFNDTAGIKDGETVTISLNEAGKYRDKYEAYHVDPDKTPWEGQTNAEFMNARMVTTGKIEPGILHRSASPFEASFGRVELMDSYIQANDIQCILDFGDTEEALHSYADLPVHTRQMINNDQVICFEVGNEFADPVAMKSIGDGIKKMLGKEGPYLVQCSLGRDRTGVICALFGMLCSASYDEIVEDYMISYNLLHKVDINLEVNPDSTQYDLFKARLDEILEEILETDAEDLPTADLQTKTRDYFKRCGMTDEELDRLTEILEGTAA